jgi:8-oxo-dGTP pyrophosphatase MutT (NUDIX family)
MTATLTNDASGQPEEDGQGGQAAMSAEETRLSERSAVSCGGVVYRLAGETVEVVLVQLRRRGGWALPKGTVEAGETLEQTALREVQEETGLEVAIVDSVGEDHYTFTVGGGQSRVDKIVHHYLLEPRGGDLSLHDDEHDAAQWFDINQAPRHLTHDSQRMILERASQLITERANRAAL